MQGIIALILGIALLSYPVETLMVIIVFLGAYRCANAIFTLFSLGLPVVETGTITGASPGKELSKCIQ